MLYSAINSSSFKAGTFRGCRTKFLDYMGMHFDLTQMVRQEAWVDITFEDTPAKPMGRDDRCVTSGGRTACGGGPPACASRVSAARPGLGLGNALYSGGWPSPRRTTCIRTCSPGFDAPDLEGLSLNRETLDGWIESSGVMLPSGSDLLRRNK